MALRLDPDTVIKGRLCNEDPGSVSGQLWLRGRDLPVQLCLSGNPHRDLAGRTLTFTNPATEGPDLEPDHPLLPDQEGATGDMTASRKVRVPTVSGEDLRRCFDEKREIPSVWKNSIYLEWFSEFNGRVVLEAPGFDCQISEPAWTMTDEDEKEAHRAAQEEFVEFLNSIATVPDPNADDDANPTPGFDDEDDSPMDEFEWEKYMKASDLKTDRLMEIHEKFAGDPDCERKISDLMGWNLPEEVFERRKEDEDDWLDDDLDDDVPGGSRMVENPLTARVRKLFMKYDRNSQDMATPVFRLCSQLMVLSAKLAGALNRLEDEESEHDPDPGFTIALLKRCLPILDGALEAATEAGNEEEAIAELFVVRDEILKRMTALRGER